MVYSPDSSQFATHANQFACGGEADDLDVCEQTGSQVTCLVDYGNRDAVTFTHPDPIGDGFEVDTNPLVLQATLANGDVCNPVRHDHSPHWNGESSWMYCKSDGFLLWSETAKVHYFDATAATWTARYTKDMEAPTVMKVASVVYAR